MRPEKNSPGFFRIRLQEVLSPNTEKIPDWLINRRFQFSHTPCDLLMSYWLGKVTERSILQGSSEGILKNNPTGICYLKSWLLLAQKTNVYVVNWT
jgi:hypothetical protein